MASDTVKDPQNTSHQSRYQLSEKYRNRFSGYIDIIVIIASVAKVNFNKLLCLTGSVPVKSLA
ncbi:hypothetical protein [Providencia sp. wls1921]|uniref:hypothetical protein n=1 Tax=Providencia sp. wls1921 TaxID=2675153 RepID=UPI0012B55657|nr:hypothetical protein [Providencia sp. wls1921]MTC44027.1 hypothetical protein [Providencia sp. wls1921]